MKKTRYFKTGLFVIGSLVILLLFILLLGAKNLFEKRYIVETYLDESVHGLDVGSNVKYRGVSIGNVKEIKFVQDVYKMDTNHPDFEKGRFVLIRMSLRNVFQFSEEQLQDMINDGLRVKITAQGLTGTSYLEIDYVNAETNKPMEFSKDWKKDPNVIYIPSSKSTFSKIGNSIDDIIKKIDKAEIDTFIKDLNELTRTLNQSVKDARIDELSKNTVSLLSELRQTNQQLKTIITKPEMQNLPQKLDESFSNLNKSMTKLNNLISNNQGEITVTVENLRAASEELKEVSSNMKKYPSYFLFGDAPSKSIKK
jgi:phospholipid/cholesterol/gamma-HCH transport system substrate-binding protein/paraquat-inducible protein B